MDGRPKRPRHYRDTSRRPKGLAGEGWTVGPRGRVTIGIPRVDRRASLEKGGPVGPRGRVTIGIPRVDDEGPRWRRVDGRPKRPRHYRDTSRRPKGLAGEGWSVGPRGRVTIGIPRVDRRASLEKRWTVGPRAALLGIYVYLLCGEYNILLFGSYIFAGWENILTGCCVGL